MFVGLYKHKLNSRGQVAVPARLRSNIPADADGQLSLYLMKLEDTPIYGLTRPVLAELAHRMSGQLNSDRRSRHDFYGRIEAVDIDPQGRVVLPQWMREAAGVAKDIVFVGAGSRIEIWPADCWNEYEAGSDGETKEDLNKLISGTLDTI